MKITDKTAAHLDTSSHRAVDPAKETAAVAPVTGTTSRSGADGQGTRLTLSSDLEVVGRIAEAARETPEIRQDVVDQVRAEIESGTLEGDLDLLAARLLQDLGGPPGGGE